jgi:hypothetical protein
MNCWSGSSFSEAVLESRSLVLNSSYTCPHPQGQEKVWKTADLSTADWLTLTMCLCSSIQFTRQTTVAALRPWARSWTRGHVHGIFTCAHLLNYRHNKATPNTARKEPIIVYKEMGCPFTHSARAGSYTGPRQLIVEASPKGRRIKDVTKRTGARFVTRSAPAVVACQSRRVMWLLLRAEYTYIIVVRYAIRQTQSIDKKKDSVSVSVSMIGSV